MRIDQIYFKGLRCIALLMCTLFLANCNSHDPRDQTPPEIQWLAEYTNLEDSNYNQKYTAAWNQYKKSGDLDYAVNILWAKGNALDYVFASDSSFLSSCLTFLRKHDHELSDFQKARTMYYIGSQYDLIGQNDSAKDWLLKIEDYRKNPDTWQDLSFAYMILADYAKIEGDLELALNYVQKQEEYLIKIKDTTNLVITNGTLARIAASIKDYGTVREAISKMKYYSILAKDTDFIASAYIQEQLLNETSHRKLYGDLTPQLDTLNHIMAAWQNPTKKRKFYHNMIIASQAIKMKDIAKARSRIVSMRVLYEEIANENLKYAMKDIELALDLEINPQFNQKRFDEALALAKKYGDYYKMTNLLSNAEEFYDKNGNAKKAYEYLKKSIKYRDSLWDNDLKIQLADLEKKYETAKKEKMIVEQSQTITKRNFLAGSMGLGLVSSILIFIVIGNRRKRKTLEKENQLQQNYTEKLLDKVEEERGRIAGELHDDVNHHVLHIKNKITENQEVHPEEIQELMEKVRTISHDLFPSMFKELGLIGSIQELSSKLNESSHIKVATRLDYHFKLTTKQELQVYRIIQEALNNIVKHSNASHVLILLISEASGLELSIRDNGTGFNSDDDELKKNSFGLSNMHQRAKSLKGKIKISSSDKGTKLDLIMSVIPSK